MQVSFMMSKSVLQAKFVFIAHAIQATPMCTVDMFGTEVRKVRVPVYSKRVAETTR